MSWTEDDRDESPTVLRYHPGQRLFNRYVLEYNLARGGMGVVWLAHDEVLDRHVALKFLPDRVRTDAASLEHLRREAQKSIQLSHHHIVKIHDFVPDAESPAISMEYVDGDTLTDLRKAQSHKVFDVDDLRPKLRQLCAALEYAHDTVEIVHRDLKPSNLLINRRGQLKIADFGIASSLAPVASKPPTERGGGTPGYMSPQQAARQPPSVLDDIYSLGATIYDLLTSRPPFYSEEKKQVVAQMHGDTPMPMEERRQRLRIRGEAIPRRWEAVVAACLAYDPARRPQSVRELAERLGLSDATTHPALQAPAPPAGLRAEAADQRVILHWQALPTAAAYNLKRSTTPGGPHTLITTVGATATYVDTGLRNEVTYYYVIEAVNAVGISPSSEEVHAQPKAPPPPVAGLSTTVGDRQVSLSWLPVAGARGYVVLRGSASGGPYLTIATVTSGTSFQDGGVDNGSAYFYIIKATSEVGDGAPSLEVSAVPCPPPRPPTSLSVEVGDRVLRLAWPAVPAVVAYHVLRARHPGGPYTRVAALANETRFEDKGLENGATYYYVVESLNAVGSSPHSGEMHGVPQPVPQRPAGLRVDAGDREVLVSWAGTAFATGYHVSRARAREGSYEPIATFIAGTSFLDTSLENSATYYYRVQAANAAGVSAPSRTISARPRPRWNLAETVKRVCWEVVMPKLFMVAKVGSLALTVALTVWLAVDLLWIRQGVRVETVPAGAAVLVDGQAVGTSPLKKKLPAGQYDLETRLEGFEPERRQVQVQSNRLARLVIPLNRSVGILQITTVPEGRHSYQIKDRDGVIKTGVTPETVKLPTGRYSVEVLRPDWPPHVESVMATKEPRIIRADFNPALVRVTSDPPGAEIVQNGKLLKSTPAELALPPLRTELVARYPGLRDKQQTVTPERGRTNLAHFIFDYGGVILSSEPPGARVKLAGTVQELGKTPYTNLVVAEGKTEYVLQLNGYSDRALAVQITRGRTVPLQVVLEKSVIPLGQLLVLTRPPEAVIYLNGAPAGQGGVTIPNLSPGQYRVRVELEGFEPEDLGDATVGTNRVTALGPVKLKPSQGVIELVSNPAGLGFELRDQRDSVVSRGVAGTTLSLTTGVYTVVVKRPDWPDFSQQLNLERNRTNRVRAEFAGGQVEVTSDPPQAEIWWKNQRRATAPASLELPAGQTILEARYPGLADKYETVIVERGKARKLAMEFDYGGVVVTSEPSGAAVMDPLTRKQVGLTPLTNAILKTGPVAYHLSLEGYASTEVRGIVEKKARRPLVLHGLLARAAGHLLVTTEPPGAEIILGDKRMGARPFIRDLPVGQYAIRVALRDYDLHEGVVTIREGVTNQFGPIRLRRSLGAVQVESVPPGAEFVLLGKELSTPRTGRTPDFVRDLPTGQYNLCLTKGVWKLPPEALTVRSGETNALRLKFPFGTVQVTTTPPGASLWLDGTLADAGVTPLTLTEVKEGDIQLSLRLKGHQPVTITTNVVRQETLRVSVALRERYGPERGEPWTNSLGMVFVPLGEHHISSIECRRRDYALFIQESRYRSGDKWEEPGFKQDASHPVVYVSWQDAQEFCRWLTDRERRWRDSQLRLDQQSYRLPTDLEWSQAAGLSGETGATAWERNEQVKGVFPWGTNWPPPIGVGNLQGAASFDAYGDTSPVGVFDPNHLGLYDLSGNVWEWCEDAAGGTQEFRVLRGGSYKDFQPHLLASAYRRLLPPQERFPDVGFRCVLDGGIKLSAQNTR